jgi:hypothetical protein
VSGAELGAKRLRTPRAAAIAGILFSLLLTATILLLRLAAAEPDGAAGATTRALDPSRVAVALHLVPFVGIAFLWFVGVLRDRLGAREDRLFATVFLGSGLLFLAMLFAGAAVMGSLVAAGAVEAPESPRSPTLVLARTLTSNVVNVYAVKMAAVFMFVTSTLVLRTAIAPRWLAWLGYALALPLLFGSRFVDRGFLVFPAWVFLVSACLLLARGDEPQRAPP